MDGSIDHSSLIRLDQYLVDKGHVRSRHRAEMLIKEHGVQVNGKLVQKPGKKINLTDSVLLVQQDFPWVSRGAFKLLAALEHWDVPVNGKHCLDVGASTGGFTQVLLEHGAASVTAIDTGTDQLHEEVGSDARVRVFEQTNINKLSQEDLRQLAELTVVDVSFVSLRSVLPAIVQLMAPGSPLITLFKPQFEVGQDYVGKGGIVKDGRRVDQVVSETLAFGKQLGLSHIGAIDSPIKGGDGNREFLLYWKLIP